MPNRSIIGTGKFFDMSNGLQIIMEKLGVILRKMASQWAFHKNHTLKLQLTKQCDLNS